MSEADREEFLRASRATQPPKFDVGDLVRYTPTGEGRQSGRTEGDYVVCSVYNFGGVEAGKVLWIYKFLQRGGETANTWWYPEYALELVCAQFDPTVPACFPDFPQGFA